MATYYEAVAIVEASGVAVTGNEDHSDVVRAALRILDDAHFKVQRLRLIEDGTLLGSADDVLYSRLWKGAAIVVRSMSAGAKVELRKRVRI